LQILLGINICLYCGFHCKMIVGIVTPPSDNYASCNLGALKIDQYIS
jgi:hypothetical protein